MIITVIAAALCALHLFAWTLLPDGSSEPAEWMHEETSSVA